MIMSFRVLKYFSSGKMSFFLFASLWERNLKLEKLMFFFRNIDPHNSRLNKKRIVISKKNVRLGGDLPNLKVNGIYGMDSCIILTF